MCSVLDVIDDRIMVKTVGKCSSLDSVDDLKVVFEEQYRDMTVTLNYVRKSTGMKVITHISIDSDGLARRRYGKQEPIDFDKLRKEIDQE